MATDHADFEAARAEQARSDGAGTPISFTLRDETFECAPTRLPGWTILELQSTDERNVTESAQAIIGFYRVVVAERDWRRFLRVVRGTEDPVEDTELLDTIQTVIEAYAGRPTGRSTGSPSGPSSTGPSSTPISSPPQVVEAVRHLPSSRAQAG